MSRGQVEGVDAKLSLIQPIIFRRYSNNLEKSKVLSSVKVHFATDCDKKLQRCKRVFQRYIYMMDFKIGKIIPFKRF